MTGVNTTVNGQVTLRALARDSYAPKNILEGVATRKRTIWVTGMIPARTAAARVTSPTNGFDEVMSPCCESEDHGRSIPPVNSENAGSTPGKTSLTYKVLLCTGRNPGHATKARCGSSQSNYPHYARHSGRFYQRWL